MIGSTREYTAAVEMWQSVAEDLAAADPDSDRGRRLRDQLAEMDAALQAWDVPFNFGWVTGRSEALLEVRALREHPHAASCGCEPCKFIRDVLWPLV